jgi:hypothetical protein
VGKNNVASNGWLNLLFQATAMANIAQNNSTSPLTNLYVSLHTADPTASGTQTSNEIAYTGYARVAVARTSGGWSTASAQSVSPVSNIQFPAGTGGTGTASFFGIGQNASGAGNLYYSGTVTPNIVCGNGVTPILSTATTITES